MPLTCSFGVFDAGGLIDGYHMDMGVAGRILRLGRCRLIFSGVVTRTIRGPWFGDAGIGRAAAPSHRGCGQRRSGIKSAGIDV